MSPVKRHASTPLSMTLPGVQDRRWIPAFAGMTNPIGFVLKECAKVTLSLSKGDFGPL
jgi:hypothetical protein